MAVVLLAADSKWQGTRLLGAPVIITSKRQETRLGYERVHCDEGKSLPITMTGNNALPFIISAGIYQ